MSSLVDELRRPEPTYDHATSKDPESDNAKWQYWAGWNDALDAVAALLDDEGASDGNR